MKETKLTAVCIMCRGRIVQAFLNLPVFNGKTVIYPSTIDKLFQSYWGFTPQRGETISFL